MNRIARARHFVKKHKTAIVFGTGAVAGAVAITLAKNNQEDCLVLPDGAVSRMQETGEHILYPTSQGDLILSATPKN